MLIVIKRYLQIIDGEDWFLCMSDIPYCDIKIVWDETETIYNTVLEKANEPNEYIEVSKEYFNEDLTDYLENRDPNAISKDDLIMALRYFGVYI